MSPASIRLPSSTPLSVRDRGTFQTGGGPCGDTRAAAFAARAVAGVGGGCDGDDRQLHLHPSDDHRLARHPRRVGQPRRHSAPRVRARRQDDQVAAAGYRRQLRIHVHARRHLCVFLRHPSDDAGDDGGALSGGLGYRPAGGAMWGRALSSEFERTVLPHMDAAHNLARWLVRDATLAQDVTQDALLRALRFFPEWRGGSVRAWLLRIVRNVAYDTLRGRGHDEGEEA